MINDNETLGRLHRELVYLYDELDVTHNDARIEGQILGVSRAIALLTKETL